MTQPRRDVGIPPDYPACPAAKWRPEARERGRGREGAKFGAGPRRGRTGRKVTGTPGGAEPDRVRAELGLWGRGARPAGDEAPGGALYAPGPLWASDGAQRAGWAFLSTCVARNCRVPRGRRVRAGRTVAGVGSARRGGGRVRGTARPQGRDGLRGEGW
ncbi:unnamed protein product [Coccothraustes coccothraustes]